MVGGADAATDAADAGGAVGAAGEGAWSEGTSAKASWCGMPTVLSHVNVGDHERDEPRDDDERLRPLRCDRRLLRR